MIRRLVLVLGALTLLGAAFAGWTLLPARHDSAAASAGAAQSASLLAAGNATAARQTALEALRSDPDNGAAHLALARAMLALEDGAGAGVELQRAADGGVDPATLHALRAEALLLQDQPDKALAEADRAQGKFRADGLRIRARALAARGDTAAAVATLAEASRIAPNDASIWVALGRLRNQAGDIGTAIRASQRAVQLAPADPDALLLRAEMVRAQFGLVAALPWFEATLKRDPERHDALIEYAATLGDSGRALDALAATRRALAVRPGSPPALFLQAVIAARAGDLDLARSLIEKTGGAIDDMPAAQLLAGALDLEAGDHQQAIAQLRALLDNQPMNFEARKLLAAAYLRADLARPALDLLNPLVQRADADSYTLTLAARGLERLGDRATAARFLDRAALPATGAAAAFSPDDSLAVMAAAVTQRPGDPQSLVPMIRGLVEGGDTSRALADAQALAQRNPGVPAAQLLLGDVLMLAGRQADAVAAYRRAADLRFDEPTMLRLVDALDRTGQRAPAANALALFLSQNPANLAALRITGHWQLAAGDNDAAIETLECLRARIGDEDAALSAELAYAYAGAGETDAAIASGEAGYAIAPGNPAIADAYGWALYRAGDLDGGAELLAKAAALAPRHPGIRWHLAQVYADLGRKPEAAAQARAALADPRFGDRAAATAMIAAAGPAKG